MIKSSVSNGLDDVDVSTVTWGVLAGPVLFCVIGLIIASRSNTFGGKGISPLTPGGGVGTIILSVGSSAIRGTGRVGVFGIGDVAGDAAD